MVHQHPVAGRKQKSNRLVWRDTKIAHVEEVLHYPSASDLIFCAFVITHRRHSHSPQQTAADIERALIHPRV